MGGAGIRRNLRGPFRGGGSDPLLDAIVASGALALWDPRDGLTLNATKVVSWVDRISGFTASQGTDASRPVLEATGPSSTGVPAVDFAGGNCWLDSTDAALLSAANGATFAMLAAFRAPAGTQTIAAACDTSATATLRSMLKAGSAVYNYAADGTASVVITTTAPTDDVDGWALLKSTAADAHSVESNVAGPVTSGTALSFASALDVLAIGRRDGITPQQYSNAHLYSLVVWATVPDSAVITTVTDALETYVGIV